MAGKNKAEDIVNVLNNAVAEAKTIRKNIENGVKDEYPGLTNDMLARYQLIMDEAENSIADEYKSSGTLTGTKICEINSSMDDYALTVQGIIALLNKMDENR